MPNSVDSWEYFAIHCFVPRCKVSLPRLAFLIDNDMVGSKSTSSIAVARILTINLEKKVSKRSNERVPDAPRSDRSSKVCHVDRYFETLDVEMTSSAAHVWPAAQSSRCRFGGLLHTALKPLEQ
jgi:hypothetical protein